MNYFGNWEKDNLLSEMKEFLGSHQPHELLEIVTVAIEQADHHENP